MDTEQVMARFEAERQALALMNHPNVAKVFDVGAAEHGRPYFTMEFVKGEAITTYCDRQRLATADRLALFIQVCSGVQHAHQKGIIHRDIKPSNVLVAIEDDKPVPKIIDFGVAKATEQKLTERTLFTQMGVIIGTPAYMSPEQAEMTALDIDTRTDVYSLGVVLYELLSGVLPFDPKELRGAGFDEMRRRIREVEPSKPSQRISTLGQDELQRAASSRSTDVPTLRRELSGDLDWIILRALAKDRTRRYASPSELAADIQRHLRNLPVEAGPPGAGYRLRKFVGRHRWGVLAGCVAAVLLLGFLVILGVQARRIAAERDLARQQRDRAEGTADFLVDMLASPEPYDLGQRLLADLRSLVGEAAGREPESTPAGVAARVAVFDAALSKVSVADATRRLLEEGILAPAARTIDDLRVTQPEAAALMHAALARTYRRMQLYGQAATHYGSVLELLGENHPEALAILQEWGVMSLGRGEQDAEDLLQRALVGQRRNLGDDHPDTLMSLLSLGHYFAQQERFGEAEVCFREVVKTRRHVLGEEDPSTLGAIETLALVLEWQDKFDEALLLYRQVLEAKQARLGTNAAGTLASMVRAAGVLAAMGREKDAEALYGEALATVAGPPLDNPDSSGGQSSFVKRARRRLDDVRNVRILFLQRVSTKEVIVVLRRGALVRRIVEWPRARPGGQARVPDAIGLSGPFEEIERAGRLLTDIGLSTSAVEPHPPIDDGAPSPLEKRILHVRPDARFNAVVLLRSLYNFRLMKGVGSPGTELEFAL